MNIIPFRFTKGNEVVRILARTIGKAIYTFEQLKGFPPDEYELSLGF